jgi:RNA polymerase sigma factor (sigma-70 family)
MPMPVSLPQIDDCVGDVPDVDWEAIAATLTRYVRRRTGRADLADDVVQETLSRLVQQSRERRLVSVYALGFRIAANLLVDHHRHDRRYAAEPAEEPASEAPLPDRVIAGQQALSILSDALTAMPPLRRDVVVRRRLHGQSCAAIARDLELSLKAVERHITRGLADLHRALAMAGDRRSADR